MNDDEFGLPVRRELPPEVRGKLRAALEEGMNPAVGKGFSAVRRPLAVAAGVTLLFGAAVVTAQYLRPTEGPGPAIGQTPGPLQGVRLDASKAAAELDRCWAAVQAEGKAGLFPDRSEWVPVFTTGPEAGLPGNDVNIVAARAGGKPLFCETTRTTVTVSDPNAAPAYIGGTKTGAVMFSPNGVISAVLDPSWQVVGYRVETAAGSSSGTPVPFGDHLLVQRTGYRLATAKITLGKDLSPGGQLALPPAPPPAVSVTDRPVTPPPDRSSAAGRFLGECLAKAQNLVADPDRFQPGPLLTVGGSELVTSNDGDIALVCSSPPAGDRGPTLDVRSLPRDAAPVRATLFNPVGAVGGSGNIIGGATPPEATRMTVRFGQGAMLEVPISHGAFGLEMPEHTGFDLPELTAKVYDATDRVLYDGVVTIR
ncbi:hypothetical protein [Amycolatopsis nigrescens]|uniref:hypothetical protein n=1 Tax=Amycolatopsis nigrescens TaxID=381445 RepID=UPI00037C972E|nr:hypothetical protein [Amycolatopsis nigrescens]